MTITEALAAEHTTFSVVFDEMEKLLPSLTRSEAAKMGRLVKGFLEKHGDRESQLAYLALDHKLAEDGQLDRLHADHDELDASLLAVEEADSDAQARSALQKAITATRRHFTMEEKTIFPLLEQKLSSGTLETLGQNWRTERMEK